MKSGTNPRHQAASTGTLGIGIMILGLLLVTLCLSCSNASKELRLQSPQPGPGVVYVAEQVHGLEEWSRSPDSRSFARVYSRAGSADEGQLVRITSDTVVLAQDKRNRGDLDEVQIAKHDVLFMRVWW